MDKRIWDKLWKDKHAKNCLMSDKYRFDMIVEQFKKANLDCKRLFVIYMTDEEPYWTMRCGYVIGYNVDNSINIDVARPPQPDGNFLLIGEMDIIRHPSNIFKTFAV